LNPELSQRVAELCNTRFHEAQSGTAGNGVLE
jgi:hypothetical protein